MTQQVHIIPQSKIEISNAPTTADLLTETGAAGIQKSQQGGGSPSSRGFEASRILLHIDNVPMNNLIYRSGHLQSMITVDPSALNKIEILYGSSSVIYGSDALGGVVHFRTKSPKLNQKFRLNSMLRTSSANFEKSGHFDFSVGSKKWAFLTSFSGSIFGDLKSGKSRNPFLPGNDSYMLSESATKIQFCKIT
ncbi:MAG: TonB-dependent receptor [Paludibacteraceae bacterium]